jgi:hypothetical protein
MPIHRSITPEDDGYFVSMGFVYLMLGLMFVMLMGLATVGWLLYNMSVQVDDFSTYNAVTNERRKAEDEMLTKRARVQQWMFSKVCDMEKRNGGQCLEHPEYWADPNNYPLLRKVDGAGTGLLPPTEEQK